MPVVRFVKDIPEIVVKPGANLMEELLRAGLPVASSCHGDGICGKCRVRVLAGAENLSRIEALEQLVRDRLNIAKEFRVSCQSQVLGDVVIDTAYW